MRRREPALIEPPARLVAFDAAEWEALVDPAAYSPDDHRNRTDNRPVGEPHMTLEQWRLGEAITLWSRARMDWCEEHGWPGIDNKIELLRQTVWVRRDITRDRAGGACLPREEP